MPVMKPVASKWKTKILDGSESLRYGVIGRCRKGSHALLEIDVDFTSLAFCMKLDCQLDSLLRHLHMLKSRPNRTKREG